MKDRRRGKRAGKGKKLRLRRQGEKKGGSNKKPPNTFPPKERRAVFFREREKEKAAIAPLLPRLRECVGEASKSDGLVGNHGRRKVGKERGKFFSFRQISSVCGQGKKETRCPFRR